jgi:hypothetical protein
MLKLIINLISEPQYEKLNYRIADNSIMRGDETVFEHIDSVFAVHAESYRDFESGAEEIIFTLER